MSLIAFGACGGDEEETSTKECTSNADCGEGKICGAEGKCVDDTNVTPGPVDAECTTNDDCTDATKPVCDNGTCVADNTQSGNCPAGEYEIDGTCYAEGDACDANSETLWMGSCMGTDVAYCNQGTIEVLKCGDEEDICGVGEDGADCYTPCNEAGAEVKECYSQEGTDFLLTSVCEVLDDGSFALIFDGYNYDTCSNGCDSEKNECVKLVEEEGNPCTVEGENAFQEYCADGLVVYCEAVDYQLDANGDYVVDDNGDPLYVYEVVAQKCGEGSTCYELSDDNWANCYSEEDKCTGTAQKQECYADYYYYEYVATYDCVATKTENVSVWDMNVTQTEAGACEEGTSCISGTEESAPSCAVLDSKIGTACDETTDSDYCANNGLITCYSGKWAVYDNCNVYSGTTCLRDTNGGNGGCYSQDSICETDNYLCESFNLYGYEFVLYYYLFYLY